MKTGKGRVIRSLPKAAARRVSKSSIAFCGSVCRRLKDALPPFVSSLNVELYHSLYLQNRSKKTNEQQSRTKIRESSQDNFFLDIQFVEVAVLSSSLSLLLFFPFKLLRESEKQKMLQIKDRQKAPGAVAVARGVVVRILEDV